jgi:peptidyl-prolyl cis-trans isomerase C
MPGGVEQVFSVRAVSKIGALAVLAAVLAVSACNERAFDKAKAGDGGPPPPGGLTAEQAAQVLAKVGDRTITLGDYAATLERMDQFDRLRYQSPERRKELLDEIIDVELLAQDARQKHLDEKPETQQAVRQILRDAILADARRGLPVPADIPGDEVRAYYEAHRDDFREPERRRVSHIVVRDKEAAQRLLPLAKKASSSQWGELVLKHSLDAPKKGGPPEPLELAGDLGIVGAPGDARGDNPRVPAAVREALFHLGAIGDVLGQPVESDRGWHIVRMTGKSDARERTLSEADRTIRVSILQQKIAERERALEAELKRQFPVTVDEHALASVRVPVSPPAASDAGPGESLPPTRPAGQKGAPRGKHQ